ncbi:hypothetical protein L2E82_21441 [Cichorium intybus]|uniref:Uncharacterized protein n=1 Tax=Cichorium intybus TaxID=13427 RepID=A0ACB9DVX0_CICIN|nr:hypothetical protein L2E82_21441 [Cichorium intybus]
MCSNSSFDLNRCDDVVIPKIDRSVFNESAGSRKQTYSRLRLAPAQSPTSAKTTIHRRTPRLRSLHTSTPNNVNGAEQAENSQIIRMLKELFKSEHNFEALVPLEVEIDTKVAVPELLNPETKPKRGRQRKHENAVFVHPPPAKRICNNTVKKVVAYNDDGDIETVNCRGVKVNLENLGRLEDPYGHEIRRRTEGMSTKDELLGFLGGLDGEWATSRKKRRVVNASDFGDALPKGWKLSLSIKKKSAHVWLFCRRYISPGGRQFDSCKEVSLYLLSLVGEKALVKSNQTQSNNSDDFALKGTSVNARDRHVVLALPTSLPRDFKKQVKSNIVNPIDVQVEEIFKCLKCFMIFEGKVSLFDHQLLSHKTERSQLDSEISELMVLKGGIFECQFCSNTYNERNQYNEHIVTHEINNTKICEPLESETAEKPVDLDPVLLTEILDNVEIKSHDATFGDKDTLVSSSPQSDHKINSDTELKVNEHIHDLNMNEKDDNEEEKAPDVSDSKSDFNLVNETSMSVKENNEKFEISVETVDSIENDIVGIMSNNEDAVTETGVTHVDYKQESSRNNPLLDFDENRYSYGIANSRVDDSAFDNLTEKESVNEDVGSKVITENFHIQDNVNNHPSNRSTEVNLDDFQIFRNVDSVNNKVDSLGNSQNGLNLELCSLVPTVNEEFNFQDDVTGIYDNAPESSETGLFDHFSVTDDIFGNNTLDEFKFGNSNAIYEDPVKKVSKIEDTFDVQTNLPYFPYDNNNNNNNNTGIEEEGFDSTFWTGGRNVITTSVCAWCRNEFQMQPEIQGGVASLCPNCSDGFSGQVNML